MPYNDTVPTSQEAKERIKQIRNLVKEQRQFPKLAFIDLLDIMTTEYLEQLQTQSIKK